MRPSAAPLPHTLTRPAKSEFDQVSHVFAPTSRWWDLLAALLLLAALSTAATRLIATKWIDHLDIIQVLAFLGALAGLALGQSRFSPRLATIFALTYGLFAIPRQLGLTLEYVPEDILWGDRLLILAGRLLVTAGQLARREAVQDQLLFLFGMSILFWALGVHAGYTLTRHAHPWRAILPAGLTLLIIQNSDPYVAPRIWALAIYLFFSLLLVARLAYLRNRIRWQQTHTHVPPLMTLDFTQAILLATVVLVLIAWLAPVLLNALPVVRETWEQVTRPSFTAISEWLNKVFASLRRTVVVFTAVDYYGESLALGRGSELNDTLVLTVQTPPGSRMGGVRHYWRARVYDHYADGQWSSVTLSTTLSVKPTGPSLTFLEDVQALDGRRTFTFTFTSAAPIATLYAAPQPRWVSLPVRAKLALNPDGTADVGALRVTPPLAAGVTYQASSSLSAVTIAQLRAAGADYPAWVTDRYLQLPATVTTRTLELARQIAVDLDTPYDIAAAITGYLRATILYTETIPPPPTPVAGEGEGGGQEPLDWFLFDLRQGFCNYYASAQVIMLRSLNIPARLAVGFAEGERQPGSNTYMVRRRDAHAWPEVYFPGLGWVEFEPTASHLAISRPLGEDESDAALDRSTPFGGGPGEGMEDPMDRLLEADEDAFAGSGASAAALNSAKVWSVALLALGVIVLAFVQRMRRRRGSPPLLVGLEARMRRMGLRPPAALRVRARRAVLPPLTRAYLELNCALARLGAPPAPADTPAERAVSLTHLLPVAEESAQRLLAEYHTVTYSPRPGDLYTAQQAGRDIRLLSWQAAIRRLIDTDTRAESWRALLGRTIARK